MLICNKSDYLNAYAFLVAFDACICRFDMLLFIIYLLWECRLWINTRFCSKPTF